METNLCWFRDRWDNKKNNKKINENSNWTICWVLEREIINCRIVDLHEWHQLGIVVVIVFPLTMFQKISDTVIVKNLSQTSANWNKQEKKAKNRIVIRQR